MHETIKSKRWERFLGFTLNINPAFSIIGITALIIKKKSRFKKILGDRISLYFWIGLALSGLISIFISYNKPLAIASYFVPFLFILFYVVGKIYIENPILFLKDIIRGTAILGSLVILFNVLKFDLVINGIVLIGGGLKPRGLILGIGDNGLGALLQVGIVGALGLIVVEKKRIKFFEYSIYMILSLGGLIISNSRGAMVGSAAGIIFLAFAISWKIMLLFSGISFLSLIASSRLLNRVKSIQHFLENNRINIYQGSFRLIRDHLWFGTGPGNFNEVYPKYRIAKEYEHHVTPHSNYLNIISGWGMIGGSLFYGWIIFVLIRRWYRGVNKYQIIIMAILISFWVHVLINDLAFPYVGLLLGCFDKEKLDKT